MAEYLITVQEIHYCRACGQTIEIGTKAIKAPPGKNENDPRYFHEGCRNYRKKQQVREKRQLTLWCDSEKRLKVDEHERKMEVKND